jgi:hypothetical protein
MHHSDRGVQCARDDCVIILDRNHIQSMSLPSNPYGNASCKGLMRALKREEAYANEYQDIDDLRGNIEQLTDRYCKRQRLHSAMGYRPPDSARSIRTSFIRVVSIRRAAAPREESWGTDHCQDGAGAAQSRDRSSDRMDRTSSITTSCRIRQTDELAVRLTRIEPEQNPPVKDSRSPISLHATRDPAWKNTLPDKTSTLPATQHKTGIPAQFGAGGLF